MGDDTPLAVISDKPRLISHFFRQNFSQVTNPPIDSLRETRVMSLKTRFGNLANILDAEAQQSNVLVLDSPVLTSGDWETLRGHFGSSHRRDRLHLPGRRQAGRAAPRRSRGSAARPSRRCARARAELFLTDEGVSAEQVVDRDGARRRRRPHPPRPQGAAFLRVDQRALGRMPRHALFRGAGRRRRHDGERLSRRGGDRRSPRARPVRRSGAWPIASRRGARRSTMACSRSCRRWGSR